MLPDHDFTDHHVAEQRTVARAPWSPAQIVALVIGLTYVVLGGVALARTGFNFSPYTYTVVAGMPHTAVLGIIEIAFGVLVLASAAKPGIDRGVMNLAGTFALAGGLIVAIQPASFQRVLGANAGNGWLFVITGVVLLVAASVAPSFASHRTGQYIDRRDGRVPPLPPMR